MEEVIAGRYEIESEIGRGGMGVVLLATDNKLGRKIALKKLIPAPGFIDTDEARRRLLREARLTSRLTDPNIVTLHDVVEEDDDLYLVLEYYPSKSLADKVTAEGPLGETEARVTGAQIASALAGAHAAGIIHRDVKPDNVLVGEAGAKLADFGIARATEDLTETGTRLTKTGFLVGTPAYMSPEQFRNEPLTSATDVFGAGSVLYYCLTGKEPFGGGDATAVAYRVVHEPLDLSDVPVADWVKSWIQAATAKDPNDRPDAEALAEALSQDEEAGKGPPRAAAAAAGAGAAAAAGVVAAAAATGPPADAAEGETVVVPSASEAEPPSRTLREARGGGASRNCPACGATSGAGAVFCGNCGAEFPPAPPTVPPGIAAAAGPPGRPRWPLIAGAAIVAVLVILGVVLLVGRATAFDEVFLESAASEGPDPFTPPVAPEDTQPLSGGTQGGGTTGSGEDGGATGGTTGGTASGPFGGTGDNSTCDRELLISFLTDPQNAAEARAWARIRGIRVDQIPSYIRSLTPTVLTADVRVTNHGFKNGKAYQRQSVLQKGTAVLVDEYGEPVVRCRCGNPLLPPNKTRGTRWVGERWPGFSPTTVVVVVVAVQPIFPTSTVPGTTTTTTTSTSTTSTTAPPLSGDADTAAEMLRSALEQCIASIDAELIPIYYDAQPGSARDVYVVTVTTDDGESAAWSVNVATGEITPGDQLASEVQEVCPNF